MSDKKPNQTQDLVLEQLRKEKVHCGLYLVNGIKLQGDIVSFDEQVVLLKNAQATQMVYKHAISTIVPSRAIDFKIPEVMGFMGGPHEKVTFPEIGTGG